MAPPTDNEMCYVNSTTHAHWSLAVRNWQKTSLSQLKDMANVWR